MIVHEIGSVERWIDAPQTTAVFLVTVAAIGLVQLLALEVVLVKLNR